MYTTDDQRHYSFKHLREFHKPFRHFICEDFLSQYAYERHCFEMEGRLKLGLFEEKRKFRFCRSTSKWDQRTYDAFVLEIPPGIWDPINIWYSEELREELSSLVGFPLLDNESAAFHHHRVGSGYGWIHEDYCFSPSGNGCRALALIYYFNNPAWSDGDGGETGLFYTPEFDSLGIRIAPLNNRLLLFEISPASYHAFLSNRVNVRNAIVGFLNSRPELLREKYGKNPLPYKL